MSDTAPVPTRLRSDELRTFPVPVLIDTREQRPWAFANIVADAQDGGDGAKPMIVTTKPATLASGDYSLDGFTDQIAIERKSINDFRSTIVGGRERFERELARLSLLKVAAVVVEAEWSMIRDNPSQYSTVQFKTLHRSVLGWQQRYSTIHWHFYPGRRFAEIATFRILQRFYREWVKERVRLARLNGEGE